MMRRLLSFFVALMSLIATAQVGDLPRSTPMAQGVDTAIINGFVARLKSLPGVDVHHLMILRHGQVIAEEHAAPYRAEDLHTLYSASKTVTGLAVGLAVDDGLLTVDDKVSKYLRDKMPATLSPALDSLTVRDMLIMAAGRKQDLSIFESDNDWLTTWFAGDFTGVGKRFEYDSMCTHALATIVTRLTGKTLLDYVRERIFVPLHITDADWELAPDSVETAGWGLRLHAESEAKLGLLMLREGEWEGRQLVSAQWIHDMTSPHISTASMPLKLSFGEKVLKFFRGLWHSLRALFTGYNIDNYFLGYGYQTKSVIHPRDEVFIATGYGGQLIYVSPKLDLVVVVNGRAINYGDELNTIYYSLVVPLVSDKKINSPLPRQSLEIEMPLGQATHRHEQRLLNKIIELEENLLGINSIVVTAQGDDRVFTMTDWRGPLRAISACGEWRFSTSDERPIYIMESREQLLGTHRPFTSVAAYAWLGDTLAMRLDWLDGGDNRRMKIAFDGENTVTVIANDNYDYLLTDTIRGRVLP